MRKILLLIVFLPFQLNAQDKFMTKGKEYFEVSQFDDALNNFLKADVSTLSADQKHDIYIKIAYCYSGLHSPLNSLSYFDKALEIDSVLLPEQKIEYISSLIESGNYAEAKKSLQKMEDGLYMEDILLEKCDYAMENQLADENKILMPVTVQADYTFFGLTNLDGKLFYLLHKDNADFSGSNYLFVSESNTANFITKLKQTDLPLNFSSPCYDALNDILYFSANATNLKNYVDTKRENQKIGVGGINNLYILSFQPGLKNNNFGILPFNNIDYSCTHPCLTDDGKTMFFSSNMLGGYGGFDLYKVIKDEEGWGVPENMGKKINTFLNEGYPFYKDGYLYFASDGLPGYGGLDIFRMNLKTQEIENLGKPINSSYDDFSFIKISETDGYFVSNRFSSNGKDNIYRFLIRK
jgi:hypothetical protein